MGPAAIQAGEQQDGRAGPVMPPFLSDLDAFGARLASIVMADLSAHALNAGPLDVPLSESLLLLVGSNDSGMAACAGLYLVMVDLCAHALNAGPLDVPLCWSLHTCKWL